MDGYGRSSGSGRSGGSGYRKSGNRGSGKFGRRGYKEPDRRRKPAMSDTICDECGKQCSVPFKPSHDKPVYCSDCFKNHGGQSNSKGGGKSSELKQINEKLDKIMAVLEID